MKLNVAIPTPATVKSACRVLEIFEYFAQANRAATVGEIASALSYPQSSTSMLLKSLNERRYLYYDVSRRTYRPTLRFALTGAWIKDEQFTGANLTNFMLKLRNETGCSIVLGLQIEINAQYIQFVPSTVSMRFDVSLGLLRPLGHTAVGKILLAQKSDDEVGLITRRINATVSADQRVDTDLLLAELSVIRKTGVSFSRNSGASGLSAIAALLPSSEPDSPTMALALVASTDIIDAERDQLTIKLLSALKTWVE